MRDGESSETDSFHFIQYLSQPCSSTIPLIPSSADHQIHRSQLMLHHAAPPPSPPLTIPSAYLAHTVLALRKGEKVQARLWAAVPVYGQGSLTMR